MSDHPSKNELSDFALGKLPAQLGSAVEAHLEECPPCQETIQSLEEQDDTLLSGLRRLAAEPSTPSPAPNSLGLDREQFVARLLASGITSQSEWEALNASPEIAAADGPSLAGLLMQRNVLTPFQAERIFQDETTGLVFGDYLVLDKLGAGGMGQVFKARHRRMDRVVALKVMSSAALNSPEAVKRFHREVKAAARLTHPNIVIAYDAGEAHGVHYLVMEYVAGDDLAHRVKQDGPLPVDLAMDYIRQAAQGLAFAHGKGIVHRDIKPANLLVDAAGTLKILDMGLARLDGDGLQAAAEGLTQSGQVMGTVDYMAPEQAFDTRQADARADTYSLGVTLYRLLTGQNLFSGETLVQKILAHREKPIPSLRTERPQVPAHLDALFHRMVAKQPGDRPSMAEIASELASIDRKLTEQSNEPTTNFMASALPASDKASLAASPSPEVKGPPRNRRPRILAGAAAAGFVFILAAVWIIFRDKDGNETGRQSVPDGGKVEVVSDPAVPATLLPPRPEGAKQALVPPGVGGRRPDEGKLVINDPAFQQWMNDVAAMPAEQQVEAVAKKLQELNPGFDGKKTHTIANGVVATFSIRADAVADISPVQAFVGLKEFVCNGSGSRNGILSSLLPLSGMRLTSLHCRRTQVSDLTPLQGMPLKDLELFSTNISDLSPLKQTNLKHLDCSYTQVSDLSPIHELPLLSLNLSGTEVSDLSALQGMPVRFLNCSNTAVSDLSPLNGMRLTWLGLTGAHVTAADVAALQNVLPNCKIEWDGPAKPPISPDKPITTLSDPAFQQWMKDIAAMPAEQQVEAVAKKLQELNAGFDGKLMGPDRKGSPIIENGVVKIISLAVDDVTDISPVRALAGLKNLTCSGSSSSKCDFSDLSPLQGLRLTDFAFGGTKISDLSPLKGMRLTSLRCNGSYVYDLSPLSGMPLTAVVLYGQPVSDLSPLKSMKLYSLDLYGSRVNDLSPLQAMPLKYLSLDHSPVGDLSPLKGMKLITLGCEGTKISDLSPLHGMPLTELHCQNTSISDLSPLNGMPLTSLSCNDTKIASLSALKGMPLKTLNCANTRVSDLAPLQGAPLTSLNCYGTQVSDVFSLASSPALASVDLRLTKATASGIAALQKALPNCKIEKPITTLSDLGFQQWMKDVAALPAEQQVEAVAKKLQELNPGFDGKLTGVDEEPTPRIENGVVTELQFHSGNVTDLSPVRVLSGLEILICGGSDKGPSKAFDLGPLTGMKLTRLDCGYAPLVSDLSPLQGMPLTWLSLRSVNNVSDLSSLRGMPLQYLNCRGANRLSDLSPLKGMPLMVLDCAVTNVSDLLPLKGMHLATFNCGNTQLSDLTPLKGMEFNDLTLYGSKVSDWSPLQDIKVTNILSCSNSNIKDLSPLRGMSMRYLRCDNTPVSDLSPLENCKRLAELRVVGTKVTAAGVAALQKALPNCKIEWDGSAKAATAPPAADQPSPAPGQP